MDEIKEKIAATKRGGKNPHSRKVSLTDLTTNEVYLFNSMQEAADWLHLSSHMPISRRARGAIRYPINDRYSVEYYNEESVTTTESAKDLQQVG